MRRTPIAHVVFPRPSLLRPVPEFAWEAAQAQVESDDLDVTIYVPIPASPVRRLQGIVRSARGANPWPEGLEDALASLEPRPVLVPYVPLPRRSVESAAAALGFALLRQRRAQRPRVIQGSFLDEGGYAAAMAGRVLATPSIAVAHGTDVRAALGEIGGIGRGRRARETLRTATRVLAASHALAAKLARLGVKAEVHRFTVRAADFPLAVSPPEAPPRILFVGRVGRAKGVDTLIEAFARLRRRDARLTLVGPSVGDLDVRAESARFGLQGRVEHLDERPQTDLVPLYASASVVVLPSRAEGFGNVLVESLLVGRPVIASDAGGPSELVDDRVGALVLGHDPEALARAIDRVLEGTFSAAALRRHALPFTFEATGPSLRDAVRALL